jgi:predicted class III extradiol MEMO1 family dioxygenase
MIVTNIADGQVTSSDLVEFKFRDIAYSITSSGQTLSGQVQAKSYKNVDVAAIGSGPYTVTLGYVNHSHQAKPVVVDSADALVMFWMAFPSGPNVATTFVYKKG